MKQEKCNDLFLRTRAEDEQMHPEANLVSAQHQGRWSAGVFLVQVSFLNPPPRVLLL